MHTYLSILITLASNSLPKPKDVRAPILTSHIISSFPNGMPPSSDFFEVRDIPNAGRGVIARRSLPTATQILSTSNLAAHVVFREYRKEVCAQCFHYDRGRTLAVRDVETGRVFCSRECCDEWVEDQGEIGVEAWRALETWVKARGGALWCTATAQTAGDRPGIEEISAAWVEVQDVRVTKADESRAEAKERRKMLQRITSGAIDPDILAYLLSGILFVSRYPALFLSDVLDLAMDPTPYRTASDLTSHTSSFLQLASLLPPSLVPQCTTSATQTLISAASHNSFGIRAGSEEDMEEYMGYALYPLASYFNHSCGPNVAKQRKGRKWEFWTSREVKEGEELCISYVGGDEKGLDLKGRRERLERTWGFEFNLHPLLQPVIGTSHTTSAPSSTTTDMPYAYINAVWIKMVWNEHGQLIVLTLPPYMCFEFPSAKDVHMSAT
ncbi:Histone-lysine N-methyltransferase set-6 [Oleoguttula sp. CCFEE 5521]